MTGEGNVYGEMPSWPPPVVSLSTQLAIGCVLCLDVVRDCVTGDMGCFVVAI